MNKTFAVGCAVGVVLGIVVCIAGVIAGSYAFKDQLVNRKQQALREPPITRGQRTAYDWQVKQLDGTPVDMSRMRGETVFLNFWSPECVNCLAQLPFVDALYEDLHDEGVAFYSIAVANFDEVPEVIEEEELQMPIYTLEGEAPKVFEIHAVPANFIIAPNGDIVFKYIGAAKWDDDAVVELLESLVGNDPEPTDASHAASPTPTPDAS